MKKFVTVFVLLFLTLSSFKPIDNNEKFKIKVVIANPEANGVIHLELYNSEDDFYNKKPLAVKQIATTTTSGVNAFFDNLPKGTYAIICYQDMNDNHKLDFSSFIPQEPWGLSNNVQLMGPPTWNDAKFEVKNETIVEIQLF